MCCETETDVAEGGCGELCRRKSHFCIWKPRGGRLQGEVILFEAPYQLEASMHIVRSLLKWEESALVGGEKRHISWNIWAEEE